MICDSLDCPIKNNCKSSVEDLGKRLYHWYIVGMQGNHMSCRSYVRLK